MNRMKLSMRTSKIKEKALKKLIKKITIIHIKIIK
jgi:hypothetical protein